MTQPTDALHWLQPTQFAGILKDKHPQFAQICKFETAKALNDGENYITSIVRISIELRLSDGNTRCERFILKIPLRTDSNNAVSGEYHELFVTEADMYTNVIPELERVYSAAAQLPVQFKPRHFLLPDAPQCDYILMEDLQVRGYANGSRLLGLDEAHTRAALAKLAQWHAASAKRVEVKGDYSTAYQESYFSAENRAMIARMNAAFELPFAECMERFDLLNREKRQIRRFMQSLNDLYVQCGAVNAAAFNVLNHGDFWLNNIMFQHVAEGEGEGIAACIFVDFQLPKYGSPAQDLWLFLMSSPEMHIKLQEFDAFVAHYHAELVRNLKALDYQRPLPQLNDLQAQLADNGMWAFVAVQRMLAVALLDPAENSNIETFMSDSNDGIAFKKRMFLNPRYVAQVKRLLPWLVDRKYLDLNNAVCIMAVGLLDATEMASVEHFISDSPTGDDFKAFMFSNVRYRKRAEAIFPWLQNCGALECNTDEKAAICKNE